jgi:hypothetical protein
VAKLVARLLATAALLVRIQAFLKNTKLHFFAVGKYRCQEFSILAREITKGANWRTAIKNIMKGNKIAYVFPS